MAAKSTSSSGFDRSFRLINILAKACFQLTNKITLYANCQALHAKDVLHWVDTQYTITFIQQWTEQESSLFNLDNEHAAVFDVVKQR